MSRPTGERPDLCERATECRKRDVDIILVEIFEGRIAIRENYRKWAVFTRVAKLMRLCVSKTTPLWLFSRL
jgi:hypothetical protein